MSGAAVATGAAVGVGVELAIAGAGVTCGVNHKTVDVTKGMRGTPTTPDAMQNINKIKDSFFIEAHASNRTMNNTAYRHGFGLLAASRRVYLPSRKGCAGWYTSFAWICEAKCIELCLALLSRHDLIVLNHLQSYLYGIPVVKVYSSLQFLDPTVFSFNQPILQCFRIFPRNQSSKGLCEFVDLLEFGIIKNSEFK